MNSFPTAATAVQSTTSHPDRRPRVLFVDDEPLLTRLGVEFLRRLGCDTITANTPAEALVLFQQHDFDLVITDLTMPGMSGIELARAMKGLRPELPVVLTTAFRQKLAGQDPVALGFSSLLIKPYNLQALQQALKEALQTNDGPAADS